MKNEIKIIGARENNLKNINLTLPKNKLIVFSGVSGSGKSSLVFNTIYEEGKRRYVNSLSAYARQFLGNTKKPVVQNILGLSPSIAIEQKTTHNNPRSIVGTITEIYDYLRLLYARVGTAYCPNHNIKIEAQKLKEIVKQIFLNWKDKKIEILSPVVVEKKGTFEKLFSDLKNQGFYYIYINEEKFTLDDSIKLEKTKKHNISIIVDEIIVSEEAKQAIEESIEVALNFADNVLQIKYKNEKHLFSKNFACVYNDFNLPKVEPKLLSFNSPVGMCKDCKGLGTKLIADIDKLIPNKNLTIKENAIAYFRQNAFTENLDWQKFYILLNHFNIDINKKIKDFSEEEIELMLYGLTPKSDYYLIVKNNKFKFNASIEGLSSMIERRYYSTDSDTMRKWYKVYMSEIHCHSCKGYRLNPFGLSIKLNNLNIYEFCHLSITQAIEFIKNLNFNEEQKKISSLIVEEITKRLEFLINVGLEYLTLNRKAETLSSGESQRIRLATQIGSCLTGIIYTLDEPSVGLHQYDNRKLINSLKKMVDLGNTLLVVEHDEETILEADHIVDIGLYAGKEGGNVIFSGELKDLLKNKESLTAKFLNKTEKIEKLNKKRKVNLNEYIEVVGAQENNLNNINVKLPLYVMTAVTGISGSGKSTLINDILTKALKKNLLRTTIVPGKHKEIKNIHKIQNVIQITQSPIGRTPRSNPATYTGVFDPIRELFANSDTAKAKGFTKSRFSFNVKGGRCDKCRGDGQLKIEMHFLPDVYIDCNHCEGKRFNNETLTVKVLNHTIADVLNLRVSEALELFKNFRKIKNQLQTLVDVGLGYISLGQNATTLSGGEAQRIKLATFLHRNKVTESIFILDEPTTGLHPYDVKNLLKVLNKIIERGNTVVLIEHNLDVIKISDWVIDLGPGGGVYGGNVIAEGTPLEVSKNIDSKTGQFLKRMFEKD